MTVITLPPRKPEWLRQQLSMLEQRQQMIRDHTSAMHTERTKYLSKGVGPPPHLLLAIDRSNDDLAQVQQQLAVLTTGWAAINTAP